MKKINLKITAILFSVFGFISTVYAGFDITRMTTVVDDYQGSYTATNSGRRENQEFSGTEIAEFSNFHPIPENGESSISGTLSKIMQRNENGIETTADAQLVFSGPEGVVELGFGNLEISGNRESGIVLDGIITVNGEDFEPEDLPPYVHKLLKSVFKLTH